MSRREAERRHRGAERKPRPQGNVSAARLVAYDVLRDVEDRDAYANLALPSRIREAGLDSRDAGLATELAAGALRGRGRYDRIIELAANRTIDRIDSRTRNVLRLGAHQLLATRVAPHAAVHESVELQRRVAGAQAAGFVNGVLRAIGRQDAAAWDARIVESAASADAALADRTSHPGWIVRALRDALRAEERAEELEALLEADNRAPAVQVALLPGNGLDGTAIDNAVDGELIAVAGPSPIGAELVSGDPGRIIAELGAEAGTVRVQDQGSQLAALALTRARPVRAGERWMDVCAGPGGKTAVLAAEATEAGASVRANEVSAHRTELVAGAVAAFDVELVTHDGRDDDAYGGSAEDGAVFDRILVDAPCSGLGALRRRPEARWRKTPGEIPGLTRLQEELLAAAADHLAPGGILAYVTCSPHVAETRGVLNRFLRARPELTELDAHAVLDGLARKPLDLGESGLSAQLWPHRNGTDAMFVALLERTG
ncbi:transcription antitermination factor NusB [Leucobacter tardus]